MNNGDGISVRRLGRFDIHEVHFYPDFFRSSLQIQQAMMIRMICNTVMYKITSNLQTFLKFSQRRNSTDVVDDIRIVYYIYIHTNIDTFQGFRKDSNPSYIETKLIKCLTFIL